MVGLSTGPEGEPDDPVPGRGAYSATHVWQHGRPMRSLSARASSLSATLHSGWIWRSLCICAGLPLWPGWPFGNRDPKKDTGK